VNKKTHGEIELLNRDLSFIDFNERVLTWASRESVPALERLRFLTIVSSNLDEFFEIRMAGHLVAAMNGETTREHSRDSYVGLSDKTHRLVQRQYQIYNKELLPSLKKIGIQVLNEKQRNAGQRKWVKQLFENQIQPLLAPIALDPSHPFPQVASKSLNYVARLEGKNAFGRENEIAIIQVPRIFPRFFEIPSRSNTKQKSYSSLSSIIRAHLQDLFDQEISELSQFRVTRHSDLALDEDEVKNLRNALKRGLQSRPFGRAIRMEVASSCSEKLAHTLLDEFALPPEALYKVDGPVNLVRTKQLIDLNKKRGLEFPTYTPKIAKLSRKKKSSFLQLKRQDVLLHHPFEPFSAVIDFLQGAVEDPDVIAIHMTIYRTGTDSVIMDLLKNAVSRGKVVMVVVELKARFDEEANIHHAEELQALGAQVVYGIQGLKTHSKMILVTRREKNELVRYAHLSTGNYNEITTKLYTDLGYMTNSALITKDVEKIFKHIASQTLKPKLSKLLLAPFDLAKEFKNQIQTVIQSAKQGEKAIIRMKMNSLTDRDFAFDLMNAAKAGVCVELIVRGSCIVPSIAPTKKNSGYLRVRSVIGRFLEHSRVYLFQSGRSKHLFLSSADLMSRNMHGRIEIAWPIEDRKLIKRIEHECFENYFEDTETSWELHPDGKYIEIKNLRAKQIKSTEKVRLHDAQQTLMLEHGFLSRKSS